MNKGNQESQIIYIYELYEEKQQTKRNEMNVEDEETTPFIRKKKKNRKKNENKNK